MAGKKEAPIDVEVDGKTLHLTNQSKVLYPKTGFTKGQVVEYYRAIAPTLVPHLLDHPLTLKRYPNGVDESFFYEKQSPKHRPDWIETIPIQASQRVVEYTTVDDAAGLMWLANLASIEIHPLLAKAGDLEHPVRMTFDLDPGPPATVVECAQVALLLKEVMSHLGLECFPKTSGSKGMQIDLGLDASATFDETKEFAHALARVMEKQHPDLIVSRMEKAIRKGKIFIDWSQNHITKTTVSVYSMRAVSEQRVSTPVTWDEVAECAEGKPLSFETDDVLARVEKMGDLHRPVMDLLQRLPSAADLAGAV